VLRKPVLRVRYAPKLPMVTSHSKYKARIRRPRRRSGRDPVSTSERYRRAHRGRTIVLPGKPCHGDLAPSRETMPQSYFRLFLVNRSGRSAHYRFLVIPFSELDRPAHCSDGRAVPRSRGDVEPVLNQTHLSVPSGVDGPTLIAIGFTTANQHLVASFANQRLSAWPHLWPLRDRVFTRLRSGSDTAGAMDHGMIPMPSEVGEVGSSTRHWGGQCRRIAVCARSHAGLFVPTISRLLRSAASAP